MRNALTFDDVTLAPVHSDIKSRKDPDTSTKLSPGLITLAIPVVSSPMNTVTEAPVLRENGHNAEMHRKGGAS